MSLLGLMSFVSSVNMFHKTELIELSQRIVGSTVDGVSIESDSELKTVSNIELNLSIKVNAIPAETGIIFSTCPGRSDALEISMDRFRNIFVSLGIRSSGNTTQVIKLLEEASYDIKHSLSLKLDFEHDTGAGIVDGESVIIAEARPGRQLDLRRTQLAVCSPAFHPVTDRENFEGTDSEVEMRLESHSQPVSLRSFNIFFLLLALLGAAQMYSSKKNTQRDN